MKKYLIDFFKFNDWANKRIIRAIKELPDNENCLYLFSHVITSQDKWLNRILKEWEDRDSPWYGDVYPAEQLENRWTESLNKWLGFLEKQTDESLENEIIYESSANGKKYKNKIREIAFQLNCHSVHHRAQMARAIREQGFAPPATDYIFTVVKKA
jgi:uncharacterized damage-inducible protein DinB